MLHLNPSDVEAIALSAKVALAAATLSLPIGIMCAYIMAFRSFKGKILLEVCLNLPLTLPPVVIGYLLLLLLGNNSWIGALLEYFGIEIIFTWKAAVIASAVVGFPLLVRSIRLSMESIDYQLILASRTLGAHWYDTLITIILPLSQRGILAGCLLMFARSLGEFGATIIVAGNIPGLTQTIPLAIYDYASAPASQSIALTLCAISVLMSAAVLIIHEVVCARLPGRN